MMWKFFFSIIQVIKYIKHQLSTDVSYKPIFFFFYFIFPTWTIWVGAMARIVIYFYDISNNLSKIVLLTSPKLNIKVSIWYTDMLREMLEENKLFFYLIFFSGEKVYDKIMRVFFTSSITFKTRHC